jgi:tyrosinase
MLPFSAVRIWLLTCYQGGAPWTVWSTTVRSPTSNDADAVSRNNLVALELDKNRPNLQSRVFNVLAMQHIYSDISNDLQAGDSLENVHDTIHNTVGGNGHLSWLAYAAFDPIFWLHHV